jgi:hypothetical protein
MISSIIASIYYLPEESGLETDLGKKVGYVRGSVIMKGRILNFGESLQ